MSKDIEKGFPTVDGTKRNDILFWLVNCKESDFRIHIKD